MFKRLMMGLIAASLLLAWVVVPDAEALRRYWATVRNVHDCGADKNCFGAVSVTDQLYGVSWVNGAWVATCEMTGIVFCNPVVLGDCPVTEDSVALGATDFLATETITGGSASNETSLSPDVGQAICNDNFGCIGNPECTGDNPDPATIFDKFWPQDPSDELDIPDFVARTTYTFDDNSTLVIDELCYKPATADPNDPDGYLRANCVPYTGKLPCCGGSNTLTVDVEPVGAGTVISDPDGINCNGTADSDCKEVYTGTTPVYDTCPEVTLTATPGSGLSGYEFTGWSGGGCSGITDPICKTSAKDNPTVTANFKASYHTLTVEIIDGGDKGQAYIWQPKKTNFDNGEYYCKGTCYKKFGDSYEYPMGESVVIKRSGAPFLKWGGICEGVPNSSDTCSFIMTESIIVKVFFLP